MDDTLGDGTDAVEELTFLNDFAFCMEEGKPRGDAPNAEEEVDNWAALLEEVADDVCIKHRHFAAKRILECLHRAGSDKEKIDSVISAMCKLSEDEDEMVRYEVMDQIPSIALFCKDGPPELRCIIRQQLVPYTVKLLSDNEIQVRKVGHSCLFVLLENNLIDSSQLSEWICPLLSQFVLTHSNDVELRVEDIAIMSKISPLIGKDLTVKFFLEAFLSVCCDTADAVRKVCVNHLKYFCWSIGQELTESTVLLAFINMCNDDNYEVRKTCIEAFVDVAMAVSLRTRREILADIFMQLIGSDYEITLCAANVLGKFISTFADPLKTGLSYSDGVWVTTHPGVREPGKRPYNNLSLAGNSLHPSKDNEKEDSGKSSDKACDESFTVNVLEHAEQVSNLCRNFNRNYGDQTVCEDSVLNNNVPLENENVFNDFQFWKDPLPDIDLDNYEKIYISPFKSLCENPVDFSVTEGADESESFESSHYANNVGQHLDEAEEETGAPDACDDVFFTHRALQCSAAVKKRWAAKEKALMGRLNKKPKKDFPPRNRGSTFEKEKGECEEEQRLSQEIVPEDLLSLYLDFCEGEGRESCAHYFPAVAYALGPHNWPLLRDTFLSMAKCHKWEIRWSMASCLHELAVIVEGAAVSGDLLPAFYEFLGDVELVRTKALQHGAQFLKHLSPAERMPFLSRIKWLLGEQLYISYWRYRHAVAECLLPAVELFAATDVHQYFLPVALKLLDDKVSAVRHAATKLVAVILGSLSVDEGSAELVEGCLDLLEEKLLSRGKWLKRQMYVLMWEEIARRGSLPEEVFLGRCSGLLLLGLDSVPNVRIALARCLANTLVPLGYMPRIESRHCELVAEVSRCLLRDLEKDVRHFALLAAGGLPTPTPEQEEPR